MYTLQNGAKMTKVGRPKGLVVSYTEEQVNLAIELAAIGEPLKVIVGELLTTEYRFWKYRQEYPDFDKIFCSARNEGLEHLADALITLADEYQDVQRARLKSDNYKWLLSKRKPAVYGDKVDIHVSQTIDIGTALKEARQRASLNESIYPVERDAIKIEGDFINIEEDPE